ncbi:MAG: hypothetical protein NVV63_12625 [Opitutus sp.]|nr:hypothetical protein [Opitutus sp.]
MSKTSKSSASNSKSLALVPQKDGSALVQIATKTNSGTRLMTKWEFRRHNDLSRAEVEKLWPEYVKANAERFNAQTAALIAGGKMHITSFAVSAKGNITVKARKELPQPEEVKTTKKEQKAMDESSAMKALGLTPEMLEMVRKLATPQEAPAAAAPAKDAEAEVIPAAPAEGETKELSDLLSEASAAAAQ